MVKGKVESFHGLGDLQQLALAFRREWPVGILLITVGARLHSDAVTQYEEIHRLLAFGVHAYCPAHFFRLGAANGEGASLTIGYRVLPSTGLRGASSSAALRAMNLTWLRLGLSPGAAAARRNEPSACRKRALLLSASEIASTSLISRSRSTPSSTRTASSIRRKKLRGIQSALLINTWGWQAFSK